MRTESKHLIVGASGATGKHLVEQLLALDQNLRVIVRSLENIPESWKNNEQIEIIHASLLELSDEEMVKYTHGCNAIASCLGHTMSWKGVYGRPRRLVSDSIRRLTNASIVNNPDHPVKFVLMNTTGNRNRDLNEPISLGQKLVIGLLRLLLPPHVDNEQAADYLRTNFNSKDSLIEWIAVRPDGLIDETSVSAYEVYPSPIRSAIFNAGKTSRINVGHFMASLMTDAQKWNQWQGQMPVIYNAD